MLNAAEIRRADPSVRACLGIGKKAMETRNFRNFTRNFAGTISGNTGPALAFAAPPRYLTA